MNAIWTFLTSHSAAIQWLAMFVLAGSQTLSARRQQRATAETLSLQKQVLDLQTQVEAARQPNLTMTVGVDPHDMKNGTLTFYNHGEKPLAKVLHDKPENRSANSYEVLGKVSSRYF